MISIDYYDKDHRNYYDKYRDELEQKPYDKAFLIRFCTCFESTEYSLIARFDKSTSFVIIMHPD